jgi:hypothetical protein
VSQDVTDCPRCGRRTPAARGACMYCGEALPISAIRAAPLQRNIDSNDLAFNTILEPSSPQPRESAVSALAAALKIETEEADAFISTGKPIPIARSQNRQEAEMIVALVRNCGLAARVVADQDLRMETDLARARKIIPGDGLLEVQHTAGVMSVPLSEIRLIVLGALKSVRVDYTETSKGMRGQAGSVIDTAEYRSQEMIMDVYAAGLERSFRIKSDAFDYSGLVWPLSFRAEVNFQSAIAALRKAAPRALFDDDFMRLRGVLSRAWPERARNEAQGIKRSGLAYRPVAKSSVVSDNRDQFDRYSRLMFVHLQDSEHQREA